MGHLFCAHAVQKYAINNDDIAKATEPKGIILAYNYFNEFVESIQFQTTRLVRELFVFR
jgi:hypothetical protein